jgi:hypothetical protein
VVVTYLGAIKANLTLQIHETNRKDEKAQRRHEQEALDRAEIKENARRAANANAVRLQEEEQSEET